MFRYIKDDLSKNMNIIRDKEFIQFQESWFDNKVKEINRETFIKIADDWFKSSKINDLQGWRHFDNIDITNGNTQYIESFFVRYGLSGFQILENEYAYYTLMGKHGCKLDRLEPNLPLLLTIPHYNYGGNRPEYDQLLAICENRNIDIHIDFAWIPLAKGIDIDLSHPNIKSFAMSISKFAMTWNKAGLRWSKQRTMDPITIMNHYYRNINSNQLTCGAHMMQRFDRDHIWNKYEMYYNELCDSLDTKPTNIITVLKFEGDDSTYDAGKILTSLGL